MNDKQFWTEQSLARRAAARPLAGGCFRLGDMPPEYLDPSDPMNRFAYNPAVSWTNNQRRTHPEFNKWKWAAVSPSGIVTKSWSEDGVRRLDAAVRACERVVLQFGLDDFSHLFDFQAPHCAVNVDGGGGMTTKFCVAIEGRSVPTPALRVCAKEFDDEDHAMTPIPILLHELAHVEQAYIRGAMRSGGHDAAFWHRHAAFLNAYCEDSDAPEIDNVRVLRDFFAHD